MDKNKSLTIEENFNLAIKNHQENKTDIAQELYNQVLKINPKHLATLNNLGTIFQGLGKNQKAKSYFEKVIEINPNHINAYVNLGIVFHELVICKKQKTVMKK